MSEEKPSSKWDKIAEEAKELDDDEVGKPDSLVDAVDDDVEAEIDLGGIGVNQEQNSEITELKEQLAASKDKALRAVAELDNVRRRAEKEVANAHKYAVDKFCQELLPVIDSLERAMEIKIDVETESVKALYEGMELTLKLFDSIWQKFGIEQVDPMGEPFDPALHEAMSMQEAPDAEPNTVIAVVQKGYKMHERLVRPAMVVVSKGEKPAGIDTKA